MTRIEGAPGTPAPPPKRDKDQFEKLGREFEAMFWREMLKNLRQDSWSGGAPDGGAGSETYREMFHESLADSLASRNSLGLAELFRRHASPSDAPPPPAQTSRPRDG